GVRRFEVHAVALAEGSEVETFFRPQAQHQRFEREVAGGERLLLRDRPRALGDLLLPRSQLPLVPPTAFSVEGVGGGAEPQVGDMAPVFLVVARAMFRGAGEI